MFFISIVDAEEDCSFARQPLTRSELRFRECLAVRRGNAHDFAGGTHFRAKDSVDAAELVEWKYRRLDRIKFAHGDFRDAIVMHQRKIHVGEFPACH